MNNLDDHENTIKKYPFVLRWFVGLFFAIIIMLIGVGFIKLVELFINYQVEISNFIKTYGFWGAIITVVLLIATWFAIKLGE